MVYWIGLEKRPLLFSIKLSSHVGCPHSGVKMVNKAVAGVSHSCLLIELVQSIVIWQSHCDLRVVKTTAYLKAIREVY